MDQLVFDGVTVDFPIYDAKSRSLKHRLVLNRVSGLISRSQHVGGNVHRDSRGIVLVRALDALSFSIADGERIAIVGHNGAGKTTLLRVAAGIYEPTVGEVRANGRVMPLFNIMEGLMPDATGLEMIRLRGTLLGFTEAELADKTAEVVEFCELDEYIQMPVRTYSTGMLVRLMFAITTAVDSDILIMDEFIGAGDAAFLERAQVRLKNFVERASVLLLATHSPDMARQWCSRAMLMSHGRLVEFGPVNEVWAAYERLVHGG
jgi:ABC-type polysaccharide/polyol phosphate transport system ATPase subunit